jgi:CheY-like chemotaxis protein
MELTNKSIFIVEDYPLNKITYQLLLTREGAHVEFDSWGIHALIKLRMMERIDLIILDLHLRNPRSGYDLYLEIRADKRFDAVPIIAVSAAEPNEAMRLCNQMGFNGYIAKPIHEAIFAEQLVQIMAGEAVWAIYQANSRGKG